MVKPLLSDNLLKLPDFPIFYQIPSNDIRLLVLGGLPCGLLAGLGTSVVFPLSIVVFFSLLGCMPGGCCWRRGLHSASCWTQTRSWITTCNQHCSPVVHDSEVVRHLSTFSQLMILRGGGGGGFLDYFCTIVEVPPWIKNAFTKFYWSDVTCSVIFFQFLLTVNLYSEF